MLQQDLEKLILDEYKAMYRIAYMYVKNEQDAMDVVQDSVYKALKKADTLRNTGTARSWLFKIVVNTAYDLFRKRKREVLSDEVPDQPEIQSKPSKDEYDELADALDLNTAMEMLSPDERLILTLRFFEDRQIKDAAEIMGLNENTAKSLLYRTLKKLRINMDG